ncbi:hypothetical protein KNU21_gp81 [Gordonia phage Nordenberg]|uniref:DUF7352 domain-containing protein n=2 Tax=Vividuovirus TaxID=2560251 RepID=A0A3G3M9K1_9CAUD|nr:hypothetical protein KNU21_gp81 [Gordonia phage Nordenberg]YP_010109539.1 hypothetical protein KNV17_gp85 [Gordonia phage Paries]AYR03143.1 hypothetical protein SEA_NORDENBERG_81 [Gordonia phage Nordenberg]QNJ55488.1 hypothetical protein SEA_PARIES_85 [Gordonia phage Paries]
MNEPTLTIHRRTVGVTDWQSFTVPGYVKRLLSVALSRDPLLAEIGIDIWYEVYPEHEGASEVAVQVIGTGGRFPTARLGDPIGTVVTPAGMVWHVYAYSKFEAPQ